MTYKNEKYLDDEIALLKIILRGSGQEFTEQIYHYVLSRPVDADGLATYSSMLASGCSKLEIISNLIRSNEYRRKIKSINKIRWNSLPPRTFVKKAYRSLLWRDPDTEGFEHYVSAAQSPDAYEEILRVFSESEEGKRINARKIALRILHKLYRSPVRFYLSRFLWACHARSRFVRLMGNRVVAELIDIVCQHGQSIPRNVDSGLEPRSISASTYDLNLKSVAYAEWEDSYKKLPDGIQAVLIRYLQRNNFSGLIGLENSQSLTAEKVYQESYNQLIVRGFYR